MHPEYVEKAHRGAGWYILLEDGTLLQGGPYPSEEATWAGSPSASLEKRRSMGARRRPRKLPSRRRANLRVGEDCSASPQRLYLAISGQAMNADAGSSTLRTSWRRLFAVVGIAAILEACAFQSGTTYAPGETGTVMRVESAQIILSREVLISGLDSKQAAGWGTVVGATLAGAAAYGLTEADNPAGVAVTIIAAVVGGLAGLAAEERRQTRRGAEYILRDRGDETIAVVQSLGSGEAIHQPGSDVSLIYGSRSYVRVVPVQA